MHIVLARSSNIYDDSRATKEILALLECGNTLTVIGWDRNGDAEAQCVQVFSLNLKKIRFLFYSGNQGKTVVEKILSREKWSKWLKKQLNEIINIDVIHACDLDTGNVVRKFAKKHNIKYVYDIYDYYVDAHPVPSLIKDIVEKQEIKTINESSTCIICTEERKEQIKFANPRKLVVIHNSPEVEEYTQVKEEYDYVYCGSLYGGRLIEEILTQYKKHSNYRFVFAGYGQYKSLGEQLGIEYSNFMFMGAVKYEQVIELEKKSKVISAIYNPSIRNHRLCAPNKFYEALALGKPLIVCKGTGIDQIVKENNLGIVIDYDAEDFFRALEMLVNNPQLCAEMGERGKQLYHNKYSWTIMKKRLIDIYRDI